MIILKDDWTAIYCMTKYIISIQSIYKTTHSKNLGMFFFCYICLNTCTTFPNKSRSLYFHFERKKRILREALMNYQRISTRVIWLLGEWTKYFTNKLIHTSVCWEDSICHTVFFMSCSFVGLNFHVPWRHLCCLGDRLSFFLAKTFEHFKHETSMEAEVPFRLLCKSVNYVFVYLSF